MFLEHARIFIFDLLTLDKDCRGFADNFGYGFNLRNKLKVLWWRQSLSTIAESLFRTWMNFNDESVGSNRNRGTGQRCDHIIVPCAVRRIDDHRQ
jgi:hypothetical protein